MPEFFIPGGSLYNESEFNSGNGSCGPTILAGALRWSKNQRGPIAKQVVTQMQAWGLCGPTGVTNTPKLIKACDKDHYNVPTQLNVPNRGVMHFATDTLQGVNGRRQGVCILEIANGQALRDYLSGLGEDAQNLQFHFIGLVGYNSGGYSNFLGCQVPQGFHTIDGASLLMNPLVAGAGRIHRFINTQLGYYPFSVVAAAQPYDIFAVTR